MKPKTSRTSYHKFIQQFKQHNQTISKANPTKISRKINTSVNQSQLSQSPCQKNHNLHEKTSKINQNTSQLSQRTIKNERTYNYNRFIEQITEILLKIIPQKPSQLLAHKILYIQYLEAFKGLKMIHHSYEPYPNDLVGQLWHQCLTHNNVANFIFIVGSILKFSSNENTKSNSSIDNYLSLKYQNLRLTRLKLIGKLQMEKNHGDHFLKTQKSKELLKHSKSRQNIDRYPYKVKNYSFAKIKMSSSNQKIRLSHELSDMLTQTNPIKTDRSMQDKSKVRSQILYKLQKSKSAKKKENKITIDSENVKNLMSSKSLLRQKSGQKLNKDYRKVKGQQNNIHRIIKGRVEREIKDIITDKGSTYNQKLVQKMRKQKYKDIFVRVKQNTNNSNRKQENKENKEQKQVFKEQKQQKIKDNAQQRNKIMEQKNKVKQESYNKDLIVVNIFIEEDRCEKLTYHKGKQSISDAAQRFVNQYQLGEREKDKLINELENVIKFSLTSIKEEEEESIDQQSKQSRVKRAY